MNRELISVINEIEAYAQEKNIPCVTVVILDQLTRRWAEAVTGY